MRLSYFPFKKVFFEPEGRVLSCPSRIIHRHCLGFVRVKAKVWNIESPWNAKEVTLLADTGAIYTVFPETFLKSLGVKGIGRRRFRLANNQVLEREIGIIGMEINDVKTHTIAVFGDENVYLLGVVTLEELGLEVDPIKGELKPLELLLMLVIPISEK